MIVYRRLVHPVLNYVNYTLCLKTFRSLSGHRPEGEVAQRHLLQ